MPLPALRGCNHCRRPCMAGIMVLRPPHHLQAFHQGVRDEETLTTVAPTGMPCLRIWAKQESREQRRCWASAALASGETASGPLACPSCRSKERQHQVSQHFGEIA